MGLTDLTVWKKFSKLDDIAVEIIQNETQVKEFWKN